jgi:hypothetical protein
MQHVCMYTLSCCFVGAVDGSSCKQDTLFLSQPCCALTVLVRVRVCRGMVRVRGFQACCAPGVAPGTAAGAPAASSGSSSHWPLRRPARSCPSHPWAPPLMQVQAVGRQRSARAPPVCGAVRSSSRSHWPLRRPEGSCLLHPWAPPLMQAQAVGRQRLEPMISCNGSNSEHRLVVLLVCLGGGHICVIWPLHSRCDSPAVCCASSLLAGWIDEQEVVTVTYFCCSRHRQELYASTSMCRLLHIISDRQ